MLCYFFSVLDCHLLVNGEYLGLVNKNVTFYNVCESDLLSFIPVNFNYFALNFTIKSNPNYVYAYNENLVIIPEFSKKRNLPYSEVLTKNCNDFTVKVVTDGSIKFYLNGLFYAKDELPFLPTSVEFKSSKNYLYLIFKSSKYAIFIYDFKGNVCFKKVVDSYNFSDNLTVFYSNDAYLNLTFKLEYVEGSPFTLTSKSLVNNVCDIPTKFIPYAFLNCLQNGFTVNDFLSDSLLSKANALSSFIGEILYILPPFDNEENACLIVSNKSVSKAKFTFEFNKISNLFLD